MYSELLAEPERSGVRAQIRAQTGTWWGLLYLFASIVGIAAFTLPFTDASLRYLSDLLIAIAFFLKLPYFFKLGAWLSFIVLLVWFVGFLALGIYNAPSP